MLNRRDLLAAAGAASAAVLPGLAHAQAFPSRPIKLVVPFPPGGTGDIQARLVAEHMAKALGQAVVVENRAGGGTVIGTAQVANAPADGYTLLLVANSFVINAKLRGNALPYKGLKAFEPVACLTSSPQMVAVNSASPYRTFKEWLDAARAKPNTISYATLGPATAQHIAGEMLLRAGGIRMTYVPYPGGAAAVGSVVAGHVDTVIANVSEVQPFVESGKLRALAVTTAQRLDAVKQVPTVAETLPGYEAVAWFGLSIAAGTPRDVIAKLAKAATDAIEDPEIRKKLIGVGLEPYPMSPDKFGAHIADQYDKYSKVIDEAGIKL